MQLEELFSLAGTLALAGWLPLALVPLRFAWPQKVAVGVALLISVGYVALIGVHWAQSEGGFGSLADVSRLFENRGLLLAGWVHYLAFDLLVGAWNRREATRIGLALWLLLPCLLLTFLFGPLGWLMFMALRFYRMRATRERGAQARGGAMVARLLAAPRALLHDAEPRLATGALLALLAMLPVLLAMMLDTRTVNDIDIWIKPAKFLFSFVIFLGTLAWVFGQMPRAVQDSTGGRAIIGIALTACVLEGVWLIGAAAAGVPSHFNQGSVFWSAAYSAAGVGAVAMIAIVLWQGVLVARQPSGVLAPALQRAITLGAVIAFGGTLVTAGYLSSANGHWVGGTRSDAGGLPLMGWSRDGGDLRVAHFFALHAQQALPLLGVVLVRLGRPDATRVVWVGAAGYVGLIVFTFAQALAGKPFLPWLG
jgi:hypothetical protein